MTRIAVATIGYGKDKGYDRVGGLFGLGWQGRGYGNGNDNGPYNSGGPRPAGSIPSTCLGFHGMLSESLALAEMSRFSNLLGAGSSSGLGSPGVPPGLATAQSSATHTSELAEAIASAFSHVDGQPSAAAGSKIRQAIEALSKLVNKNDAEYGPTANRSSRGA